MLMLYIFPVSASEIKSEWVIAAAPFTVRLKNRIPQTVSAAEAAAAANNTTDIGKLLPSLILTYIENIGNRAVLPDESEQQRQYQVRQKRLALLLELSAVQKESDSIPFKIMNEKERSKLITDNEKNRVAIEKKILDNIAESHFSLEENNMENIQYKPITLWKNNAYSLYTEEVVQKKVIEAKINALISGTIEINGEFISANAILTIYPGETIAVSVHDIGSLDNIELLAQNIAVALIPFVLQSTPSSIAFELEPLNSRVYIDGTLLLHEVEPVLISGGSHSIVVEHDSYNSAAFIYDFKAGYTYIARIHLAGQNLMPLEITTNSVSGNLFLNGKSAGITEGQNVLSVTINNQLVLGEFVSDAGINTFFTINPHLIEKNAQSENKGQVLQAAIKPLTVKLSDDIEKKRKTMYTSLGALFISLPFSLISWGSYIDIHNGWALGRLPYSAKSDVDQIKTVSDVTAGISIGLGINLAIQIGRYLYAANKVIPQQGR